MKKILFLIALCINFIFMFGISNAEYNGYDKNKIVKKLIVSKLQLNKTDIGKKYISKIDEVSKKLHLLDDIKKQEIISKIQKLEEKAGNNENIKNLLKYFEAKIFLSMKNLKENTTNSEKTQKKEKNKISENTQSEKIIFLDKNKDGEYIKIKYLTKERFIDLNSMKLADFVGLGKKITGKLYNGNVEKIIVRYKNPEYYSGEGEYQLKKFNPGDSTFLYNAFKKYRSLNFGKNIYIFEAYTKTKVSKLELEVNLKEKQNQYCLLDECIPNEAKIIEKNGVYTYKYENKEGTEISYIYDKNKGYFKVEKFGPGPSNNSIEILKFGDIYIKSKKEMGCGSTTFDQKIYSLNGKELEKTNHKIENIKIGNIVYLATLIGKGNSSHDDSINNYYENYYNVYNSPKDFQDFIINNELTKKSGKLYKSYVVKYKNNPNLDIFYNAVGYDGKSFRKVWLGTDKEYLSKNIKANGDFLDLAITNKIIGYYSENSNNNLHIFDKKANIINKIDNSKMPFFKMRKLNNKGDYLVSFKDNSSYELRGFAELCKPVVYYYSNKKEKNKLILDIKKPDFFTKLIPEFNSKKSWDFVAKNKKIFVDNKEYSYLYYSLINVGYEHNLDGWVVYGNDIIDFFEDKLTKINFNNQEKKDFIEYWKDKYKKDKYYFVSFKYKEELDKIIKLEFTKKPDKIFRVLLDSYELDNLNEYKKIFLYDTNNRKKFDKFLIKSFDRKLKGREVFEWGGVLKTKLKTYIK